jgi:hypothetical protein
VETVEVGSNGEVDFSESEGGSKFEERGRGHGLGLKFGAGRAGV